VKTVIRMIAILALCSAAEAAHLTTPGHYNDLPSSQISVIGYDLSFSPDIVEESLPEEPEFDRVTTGFDSHFVLSEKELANREPVVRAVPASELPPVTTIALGFIFLGAAIVIGRTRTERRRLRRRTVVRMRAIIAR
jgi:hypothetical protein